MSFMTKFDAIRKMQEGGVRKMQSLGKVADSFMKVAQTGKIEDDAITAGLLKNFQEALASNPKYGKVMDAANLGAAGLTGAGNLDGNAVNVQGDFGPYVMEVWPLVTAWYPDFPLKDLISVQDMDKPLAYLFFSVLKTGTAKAETAQGDVVETPLGLRTIKGKYPTGEIYGEEVAKAQIGQDNKALLAYAPLNVTDVQGRYLAKHKVLVTVSGTTATFGGGEYSSIESGKVKLLNRASGATDYVLIDITTGEVDLTNVTTKPAATGDKFVANYVWNLDYATDENIQKVKEQVEMRPIEATPRAIALEWSIFSEYVKKSQFGQDIRTDNTKRVLNLLYQYQVRYILDELENDNTGVNPLGGAISLAITSNYSLEVQVANVLKQLNKVSNALELVNGRMEGNRLIVGNDFKTYLESLPNTYFKKTGGNSTGFSGPRELGEFGRFTIYYDPFAANDAWWMTYRGNEWYDAVYYLGEYMPIVPTDAVTLGVTVREAFVAMEGYRFDKPNCVVAGTCTL